MRDRKKKKREKEHKIKGVMRTKKGGERERIRKPDKFLEESERKQK